MNSFSDRRILILQENTLMMLNTMQPNDLILKAITSQSCIKGVCVHVSMLRSVFMLLYMCVYVV